MLNGIEAMKDSGGELRVLSQLQDSQLLFRSVTQAWDCQWRRWLDLSAFFTTKPQGSGRDWPSAVLLWNRMAGSCGQAPTVEGRNFSFHPTDQVTESSPLVA
jgi:hypothetical protein